LHWGERRGQREEEEVKQRDNNRKMIKTGTEDETRGGKREMKRRVARERESARRRARGRAREREREGGRREVPSQLMM
jgi:hypothetical protein